MRDMGREDDDRGGMNHRGFYIHFSTNVGYLGRKTHSFSGRASSIAELGVRLAILPQFIAYQS